MGWMKEYWQNSGADDDVVIDLRDEVPFGSPTPCPDCGRPGYLDRIDVRRNTAHQHCVVCRTTWEIHDETTLPSYR